jgi:hypothetical protein
MNETAGLAVSFLAHQENMAGWGLDEHATDKRSNGGRPGAGCRAVGGSGAGRAGDRSGALVPLNVPPVFPAQPWAGAVPGASTNFSATYEGRCRAFASRSAHEPYKAMDERRAIKSLIQIS